MVSQDQPIVNTATFACKSCGASLKYKPGTAHLVCEYCGAMNDINPPLAPIEELDFETFLAKAGDEMDQLSITAVNCQNCGATSSIDPKIASSLCPYCTSPLIAANAVDEKMIRPRSLLPFLIEAEKAKAEFQKWIDKLWFAPSALKKAVIQADRFKGVYIPFWTYDSQTLSRYTGEQGVYYYTEEQYTETDAKGNSVNRTRQVRNTRWYPVIGQVDFFFDDILICASKSLPVNYVNKLAPWDLNNLISFDEKFLSGFICEKYQVDLKEGFDLAKAEMTNALENKVRQQIGGDDQRVISVDTAYSSITFKHLLLPVYLSAYSFKGKIFHFLVNARTGEVQGERPWSTGKIALAVVGGLLLVFILYLLFKK
jgi:LSD1 subclass zinc finger protein